MSSNLTPIGMLLLWLGGIAAFILLMVFVAVPLFKGIGWGITGVFRLVGWFFRHIFEFIAGMCRDTVRFIGAVIAFILLAPIVPVNVVFGRWSAAGHYAEAVKRECHVGAACLYRVLLKHPLRLLMLDGLLEGLEQRVPEAMAAAPTSDKPSKRVGRFDGYQITGSLRSGGSGAKLYIAEPSAEKRRRVPAMPARVVIKCFALAEGSGLPQIVRESRALECAKSLGHVLDHGMDEHRFFYVMPYHAGDHLGIVTRQAHGESGGRGLDGKHLRQMLTYNRDLVATLAAYHRGGLWHKDVKPENVIVHDGGAHLVDLGLMTSLRSAMTLTTHGTEYFRDPEMVRQALRGVKVHQVNGAKFDIYAAGAVLYFQLENTFPAHGGLSRFSLPSPEALRWIVRRAMTEYSQRYDSADDMLADINHVMAAADPFGVRPVDLPSMRGEGAADASSHGVAAAVATPMAAVVASAASAVPPAIPAKPAEPADVIYGFSAGLGTGGGKPFARFGRIPVDANGHPLPNDQAGATGRGKRRPKLSIVNWWTGAYRVDDPGDEGGGEDVRADAGTPGGGAPVPPVDHATPKGASDFREQASAFRAQAREQVRQAQAGLISARKAAREQIRAARSRAAEIRARVRAGRHARVAIAERQPTPWAVMAVVLTLGAIFGGVFLLQQGRSANSRQYAYQTGVNGSALMVVASDELISKVPLNCAPVLDAIQAYRDKGYRVVVGDPATATYMATLVTRWQDDPDGSADRELENVLEEQDVYGVLYLYGNAERIRDGHEDVNVQLIYSSRDGAEGRGGSRLAQATVTSRVESAPSPDRGLPLLLINDHPAKVDPAVEARINRVIEEYAERGWRIAVNDEAEVAARTILIPGVDLEQDSPAWMPLAGILHHSQFGGILHITAGPGDGPPAERVLARRLMPPANAMVDVVDVEDVGDVDDVAESATTSTASDNPSVSVTVDAAQPARGTGATTSSTTSQPARP